MATIKPELKAILDVYGINPRDTSQIWDCHGVLVLYHKAYEVIAAKENIKFDAPIPLEADSPNKSVAICVMGHMGERSEWSIGEASPANNKNAYPYAMAEKRAKDRVIAKLVGLAQYVYSEDEADDFKDARPNRTPVGGTNAPPKDKPPATTPQNRNGGTSWEAFHVTLSAKARECGTVLELKELWASNLPDLKKLKAENRAMHDGLGAVFQEIEAKLSVGSI